MQKILTIVVVSLLIGLIGHSLYKITQPDSLQKAQVAQSSKYRIIGSGESGGSGGGSGWSVKCKCPYRYIIVSGQGSTSTHPIFKELASVAPGATHIFLNDGKKDNPDSVKAQLRAQIEKNKAAGYKTLIIAHSMGAVIAINEYGGKDPCVEIYAIDPPVNMAWYICNPMYAVGSKRCAALIAAKKCLDNQKNQKNDRGPERTTPTNCQVNWCTDGDCFPITEHDPFSYPTKPGNAEKIAQVKKEIEAKKRSCVNLK